jgi:chromosome segregation ATPase
MTDDKDLQFQLAKDKYEERLEFLTDKVRSIYDSIRNDEVIATMRDDPTTNSFIGQRMKEICEDGLAREREETIERLIEEVSEAESRSRKVERELTAVVSQLELCKESLSTEQERGDSAEAELGKLADRVTKLKAEFERTIAKKNEEAQETRKTHMQEASSLISQLDEEKRKLWEKEAELDLLKNELELSQHKQSQTKSDAEDLRQQLMDKEDEETKLKRNCFELEAINEELKGKLVRVVEEISRQKDSVKLYEQEREEIRQKCLSYTKQFREALDTEQRTHAEAISAVEAAYKVKSSRFKRKVLQQQRIIEKLEGEIAETRGEFENVRQSSMNHSKVEDSLRRVRSEWEQKVNEQQTKHTKELSQVHKLHKQQIATLQQQYQQLLDEKIRDMQTDAASQMTRQATLDKELKRLFEDRMNSESQKSRHFVEDEINQLKASHSSEVSQLKSTSELSLRQLSAKLSEDYGSEILLLKEKMKTLEADLDEAESEKRRLRREVDHSTEKLSSTKRCLETAQGDIEELEAGKKTLLKNLAEASENITKLKSLYEEQLHARKSLETQLEVTRGAVKELKDTVQRLEQDASKQLHQQHMKFIEEVSHYEDKVYQEQANSKKAGKELDRLKRLVESLQSDKEKLEEELEREAREVLSVTQKVKAEEQLRFEKEAEEHLAAKRRLLQAESRMQYLSFELEGTEQVTDELRSLCRKYEEEVGQLKGKLQALEQRT